ncbi:LCP family protein [Candidatus Saccharibacteria bacterium]|nr:LCP family protein [Candidatus Saccharibacteria bacterium]
MPEFSRPKKRSSSQSVDGMLTKRTKKIGSPEYYNNSGKLSNEPRRSFANRQRKIQSDIEPADQSLEERKLGDFDQPEQNVFTKNEKKYQDPKQMRKNDKKAKKEKKEPGRIRRWWKNRRRRTKIFIIIGVILLILGGLFGYRLYSFLNSVFGNDVGNTSAALNDNVRPEDLDTEGDGRLNVLLLGRGGDENVAPNLTDTIIIASVDFKNNKASLLSIPRDLWVDVNNSAMKINATYEMSREAAVYKGMKEDQADKEAIKQTINTVRDVAGVPIHKYVMTDYKAFRDIVNALGGVDVNVPEDIYDGFAGWKFNAGTQTFNGDKALQYARTRHGSARGDFDRNENQRRLLLAIRAKATSTGILANPVKLNSIANAVQKNIQTDLTVDEAKKVFERTKDLTDSNIVNLDLAKEKDPLVQTGNAGGLSIVQPTKGLVDYSDIRSYTRSNMRDPYLMQENPTVTVYNGTGRAGVAQYVTDVMSAYGYKVLVTETAKENQPKTLVVKASDRKMPFTERFLFKRYGVVYTKDLPKNVIPPVAEGKSQPAKGDFVIVLGADFNKNGDSGPTW